jgi:capsular polysaccharide biosynthesis protein
VVVAFFLAGLLLPVALHVGTDQTYTADVRLMIGGPDTINADQANSLSDTAMGIVTSRGHIAEALKVANADRDPHLVAEQQVRIEPIGTSGVLELSVSDTDPAVAAEVANALTDGLVALRREVITGESTRLLDEVTKQIHEVNRQITEIAQQVSDAENVTGPLVVRVGALQLRHDAALRQRTDLEAERQRLIEALAATPEPTVIDPATAPEAPESSGLLARMAIGGLLGLVLGLGVATLLESLNPTIVSPEALSRTLGVPVLGNLPRPPERDSELRDPWLPQFLRLAANDAGVETARLVALGPSVDLHRLASWLRTDADPLSELSEELDGPVDPFPEVAMVTVEDRQRQAGLFRLGESGGSTGIVVVAPTHLRRSDLAALEPHRAVTGWPLLGVVAYKRPAWWQRGRAVIRRQDPVPLPAEMEPTASAVAVP